MKTPHEQYYDRTLGGARPAESDVLNYPETVHQLLVPSVQATAMVSPWLRDVNTSSGYIFEGNLLYFSPQTITDQQMPQPQFVGGVPSPILGSHNQADFNEQLRLVQAHLLGAP